MARLQSLTVDYLVTGSLDGATPAPIVKRGPPNPTPFDRGAQIYQPSPVVDLGLIDPALGTAGSFGARSISQLVVDLQGEVAPAGASVSVVARRGTGVVELFKVLDLAGKTVGVRLSPFVVPQGGEIRLVGVSAGADPILVRISIETPRDLSDLLATLAIAGDLSGGPGPLGGGVPDYSVNSASVDGLYPDSSIVLRTGGVSLADNGPGAYNGGGSGNKSIFGGFGFDGMPLGDLVSLEYVWENILGPGGPFFLPPGGPAVQTPYVNLIVDFDPLGAGDLRVLVTNDDSLAGAITSSIGTYANNGSNVLTYAWDDSMNVLIVSAPPDPVPGGVAPDVTVGPTWPANSYKFSDLVAANPDAILVDAFTGDGGLPAGAITPAVLLVSGDSANVTKSGKKIQTFSVNGTNLLQ